MTRHGVDVPLPGFEGLATAPSLAPFTVKISRSKKRKRSVAADVVDGVMTVVAPSWMTDREAEDAARSMADRLERQQRSGAIDLASRAKQLARRYRLLAPASIRWSSGMARQWGSCTVTDRSVRISDTVAEFPPWVLDYVIVHELAHMTIAEHSPEFWALVARYPKAERARGFLIAKTG